MYTRWLNNGKSALVTLVVCLVLEVAVVEYLLNSLVKILNLSVMNARVRILMGTFELEDELSMKCLMVQILMSSSSSRSLAKFGFWAYWAWFTGKWREWMGIPILLRSEIE